MEMEGSRLGKYELRAEIGRGGMGIVYQGYDPSLKRTVAVKVLAPHLAWEDEFVERFLREARAAAQLSHPHIVTIHDVGEQNGRYFFVMEYVEGQSLSQILSDRGRLSSQQALILLRQLADALDYAHTRGLVHRDVKPGNVMVDSRGSVKLTDFGLVRAAQGSRLTATGTMLGTPQYMSPEQAHGDAVGAPSDLYSLAVIAYEILAGAPPFDAESTPAILHMLVYEPPPPVLSHRPDLPLVVDQVFAHALAKEPEKRFRSGAAFVASLAQALEGEPRRTGAVPIPAAAAEKAPRRRSGSPPAERRPWIWLVAGAAVVLLLLVLTLAIPGLINSPDPTATQAAAGAVTDVPTPSPAERPLDTNTPAPEPTDHPIPTLTYTAAPVMTLAPTPTPEPTWTHTPTPPTIVNLTALAGVTVSDQGPDGIDTCGDTVTYSPGNLTDGQSETAWRVTGEGQGEWIRFDFGRDIMLNSVQILPGYDKRDPCDASIDWCPKNRIPRRVQLDASDGQQMELLFDNACIWQAFELGPWHTSWLQVTILDSYPRREEHHTDNTTISEIQLLGWEF